MLEIVIAKFLEYGGLLAPIVIALSWLCWKLQNQLKESLEARVTDSGKVVERIVELNDKWSGVLSELNNSLDDRKEKEQ